MKSKLDMKLKRHGSSVSTVASYGRPLSTESTPSRSPLRAIRLITILPSEDEIETLARPAEST